ncbi:hypothetical protein A6V29_06625 [Blastococcus sp. CCUG 61487]|nr:hypothetical protein A6V29_06625 [Blastococcus sp. CCUG 61487]
MTGRSVRRRTGSVLGALLLSPVVLAGCGGDDAGEELGGPGVEASVGDMELRNIRLDNPPAGIYQIGTAALLGVAMVNTGDEADELIEVSGPDFTGAVLDENPESSDPAIRIPAEETVFTDGPDGPVLVLVGIDDPTLTSGQSLEVTFTFDRAGEVTVDAPISAPLRLTLDRWLREQVSED